MNTWDRQRDPNTGELESNLWYDRFTDFRLMGAGRSLLDCVNAEKATKGNKRQSHTPGSWSRAAKKWHWRERAEMWDEQQRQERIQADEQERAAMLERHLNLAQGLQSVGMKRLKKLDLTPDELSVGEVRQYIKEGVAIERQARGLPEHLLAVATMTDDELLKRYVGLAGEIATTGGIRSGTDKPGDSASSDDSDDDTAAV